MHTLLGKSSTKVFAALWAGFRFLFAVDPRIRYQVQRLKYESDDFQRKERRYQAEANPHAQIPVRKDGQPQKYQTGNQ